METRVLLAPFPCFRKLGATLGHFSAGDSSVLLGAGMRA